MGEFAVWILGDAHETYWQEQHLPSSLSADIERICEILLLAFNSPFFHAPRNIARFRFGLFVHECLEVRRKNLLRLCSCVIFIHNSQTLESPRLHMLSSPLMRGKQALSRIYKFWSGSCERLTPPG